MNSPKRTKGGGPSRDPDDSPGPNCNVDLSGTPDDALIQDLPEDWDTRQLGIFFETFEQYYTHSATSNPTWDRIKHHVITNGVTGRAMLAEMQGRTCPESFAAYFSDHGINIAERAAFELCAFWLAYTDQAGPAAAKPAAVKGDAGDPNNELHPDLVKDTPARWNTDQLSLFFAHYGKCLWYPQDPKPVWDRIRRVVCVNGVTSSTMLNDMHDDISPDSFAKYLNLLGFDLCEKDSASLFDQWNAYEDEHMRCTLRKYGALDPAKAGRGGGGGGGAKPDASPPKSEKPDACSPVFCFERALQVIVDENVSVSTRAHEEHQLVVNFEPFLSKDYPYASRDPTTLHGAALKASVTGCLHMYGWGAVRHLMEQRLLTESSMLLKLSPPHVFTLPSERCGTTLVQEAALLPSPFPSYLQCLISAKAAVNYCSEDVPTALHCVIGSWSTQASHDEEYATCIRILCDNKADPNLNNAANLTALEALLKTNIDGECLVRAFVSLLHAGGHVNGFYHGECVTSPLHLCSPGVSVYRTNVARCLLDAKARVNTVDISGRTPLDIAVSNGCGSLLLHRLTPRCVVCKTRKGRSWRDTNSATCRRQTFCSKACWNAFGLAGASSCAKARATDITKAQLGALSVSLNLADGKTVALLRFLQQANTCTATASLVASKYLAERNMREAQLQKMQKKVDIVTSAIVTVSKSASRDVRSAAQLRRLAINSQRLARDRVVVTSQVKEICAKEMVVAQYAEKMNKPVTALLLALSQQSPDLAANRVSADAVDTAGVTDTDCVSV